MDILKLAEEIRRDKKPREITPRQLFNALDFWRRTQGNCFRVDQFLNNNSLVVEPHYNDVWIDDTIQLKHKPIATSSVPNDPIRRINSLDSASTIPLYVNNDAPLLEATTLMQSHDYSQLPVINGNVRNLIGYISWETIAKAKINGVSSDVVKDYVNPMVATLTPDTPIIQAVEVVREHDFAIVLAKDKSLYGIVTVSDVTSQFIEETEAFVLLSELECHIRNLLRDKILVEDLKKLCTTDEKAVETIDDLTFGGYITLFGNEKQWEKLHIAADRKTFIVQLEEIRQIRNDVMHFRPAGVSNYQKERLENVLEYLRSLMSFRTPLG